VIQSITENTGRHNAVYLVLLAIQVFAVKKYYRGDKGNISVGVLDVTEYVTSSVLLITLVFLILQFISYYLQC
jgi:TRAP-type mannitol/chloroaromatic compound transport system permease small subunit